MTRRAGAVSGPGLFASLFAGVGGFDLALERAGFACSWQCEIDPQARSVLERQWPEVRRFEDVREIAAADAPRVDLLCGGWPCQDLSVAGNRAGLAGERSGLFSEVVRLARLLAPRWLLLENVPGLLSSDGGRDMGAVLGALGECGYRWAYRVLDAQHFGVPQRRRRVFIVGCLGDGCPEEVLFEPEGVRRDSTEGEGAGARVAALLATGVGGRGHRLGADEAAGGQIVARALSTREGGRMDPNGETYVAQCHGSNVGPMGTLRSGNGSMTSAGVPFVAFDETQITSRENRCNPQPGDPSHPLAASARPPTIAHTLRGKGADASEDGSGRGVPLVVEGDSAASTPGLPRLRRGCGRGGETAIAFHTSGYGGQVDREKAQTLQASDARLSNQVAGVISGAAVRRLTPRECERLQGLPDDWTRFGADGKEISDSARYRMIGNSVAVPVVEWIARRLAAVRIR